ncbi:MAG: NAD(P)-dependent oxidoreductase [bacterium]
MTSGSTSIAAYRDVPVVVLGVTGFIGRWVARALAAQHAALTVVGRDRRSTEAMLRDLGIRGTVVTADLAQPGVVHDVVARVRPVIVFNLAGYGVDTSERDVQASSALNADLPPAIADAMAELVSDGWRGQHVVHTGSALEYGTAPGDLEEHTIATPTTLYGRTKLAGTLRLHDRATQLGVRAVTARLFTVYGAGEHDGRLLPSILAGARTEAPIRLSAGMQQRDFTYVADVVEGLLRLGALPAADVGVVNLATGVLTTVRRFVEIASDVAGIAAQRLEFGALPARAEEMHHDPVNVARLRSLVGWSPDTTIDEGVRHTLERPGSA